MTQSEEDIYKPARDELNRCLHQSIYALNEIRKSAQSVTEGYVFLQEQTEICIERLDAAIRAVNVLSDRLLAAKKILQNLPPDER